MVMSQPPSLNRVHGVYGTMRTACGPRLDAYSWWVSVQDLASLVDSIRDMEGFDRDRALQAISAVVLGWGTNKFYVEHSVVLTMILTNVWQSWLASDAEQVARVKAWDVTVETAKSVLFLLGGETLVAAYAPRLHRDVVENMKVQA